MTDKKGASQKRIVIVGGGFGGVKTALEAAKMADYHVTLVSERSDFYYYPTMYRTATGGSDEQSAIPLAEIFAGKPVECIEAKLLDLDQAGKTISLDNNTALTYDYLVLSLGVVTNFFGIPGLAENAYGIKSIPDAERLKRHLHAQVIGDRKLDSNYIIVGGGPTGIELAGALSAYLREIVKKHGLKGSVPHIDLVEAQPTLMPRLDKKVGRHIARRLRKLGVKLYLGKRVEGASADALSVSGKSLTSHTIVWTAGVANNPFFTTNKFALSGRGKVLVDEFLRVEGSKDVFVIGDNAETPYSGMAQTAIYDAEFVAHNFRLLRDDEPKLAYRPHEPVYVTPVGDRWASVQWGRWHFDGWLGWLLREAADIRGFLDLQSPPEAAAQWASAFEREDLCPVCGFSS
ncbi:MAG: FAD-dependent oxidoreductase [Candidatus Saccharimonadales bacterium]